MLLQPAACRHYCYWRKIV